MSGDINEITKALKFFDAKGCEEAINDTGDALEFEKYGVPCERLHERIHESAMEAYKEEMVKQRPDLKRAVLVTGDVGYIGAGAMLHNMLRKKLEDVELIEPQRGIGITGAPVTPIYPVAELPRLTDTSAYTDMSYEFRNFYNPKESVGFRPSKHGCERLQPKNKRRKRKIAKLSRKKNRK